MIITLVSYACDMLSVLSAEGGAMAEKGLPIHDIKIYLSVDKKKIKRVYQVSSGEDLKWEEDNRYEERIVIHLPVLNVHDRIVVE